MRRSILLVLRYALGAGLATGFNLLSQVLCNRMYAGVASLEMAMLLGTAVGLMFKYWFDKRWIFEFKASDVIDDGVRFARYGAFGLLTTAIFWGFELGFAYLIGGELARYSGAVLGLGIGYVLKYRLDRRYVFTRAGEAL